MKIHNWRYEDGWRNIPSILRKPGGPETEYCEEYRGWFCQIFEFNKENPEKWMKDHMKGEYDCTFRFNSGNPMYTIWIKNDDDAMLFKLTWPCEN